MAKIFIHRRDILGTFGAAAAATTLPVLRARAQADQTTVPTYAKPLLSPPLPNPVHQGFLIWDPTPIGYVVEERLMAGVAPIYLPIDETDMTYPLPAPGAAPVENPIPTVLGNKSSFAAGS